MASVFQCSAARVTTMPTRRSKRRPSFDPAEASVLSLKALARSGELPGCRCYAELSEQQFYEAAPCEHVLERAGDALLANAPSSRWAGAGAKTARPKPSGKRLGDPWLKAVRRLQKKASCRCLNDKDNVCEHVWEEAVRELLETDGDLQDPASFHESMPASVATDARPGTKEKRAVLRQRIRDGQCTDHPGDLYTWKGVRQ